MTRRLRQESSGYTIMLVDDNPDYLQATRLLLERDGHEVITATNGREALSLLPKYKIDLLLLDYFMPGMTGEQVVTEIRKYDPFVQVILQTGYASEQPPQELLRRLDIQGYYDKTEGPDQLLMWTAVGLKAAYTIQMLNRSREGLQEILTATSELQRSQPTCELLPRVLRLAGHLIPTVTRPVPGPRPLCEEPECFIALLNSRGELVIEAGTGRFSGLGREEDLDPEVRAALREALSGDDIRVNATFTLLPLRTAERMVGVLYVGSAPAADEVRELLRVFANQTAVAIQNARLFELLQMDLQTGLRARSFFDDWLLRSVKEALRRRGTVGVVLCGFHATSSDLSEGAGCSIAAEDVSALGAVLLGTTRAGDVVARFAEDLFAILTNDADTTMLAGLARRWQSMAGAAILPGNGGPGGPGGPTLRTAIAGYARLVEHTFSDDELGRPMATEYFERVARDLVASAEGALERARHERDRIAEGQPVEWPPVF